MKDRVKDRVKKSNNGRIKRIFFFTKEKVFRFWETNKDICIDSVKFEFIQNL